MQERREHPVTVKLSAAEKAGRPALPGQVHFRLTRRRCQASKVPGVTIL